MAWELANPFGILVDEEHDAWHTGRVTALLPVQGTSRVLIGSDGGGVWDCNPVEEYAKPLSDDWDDPDITALIQGPDPSLVFAGTKGGSVYVSDLSGAGAGPLGSWRQVDTVDATGKPVRPGRIWAGVVMSTAATDRLILACDNGLLWSEIPAKGKEIIFRRAQGAIGPFSGVALGRRPGFGSPIGSRSVVIAAGDGAAATQPLPGIFVGTWDAAATVLTVAKSSFPSGFPVNQMRRTSLTSCQGSSRFAYAVTGQNDPKPGENQTLLAVLRSTDGGGSWAPCGMGFFANAGNFADVNQAIAVANYPGATSYGPFYVAMGLRRGPFVSLDGGDTWTEHGDAGSGASPHLHSDVHALLFDPSDGAGNTLLVGSDGGVARTHDVTATPIAWETRPFNSRLPILQFCGANIGYRGGTTATSDPANLVGGGLQDNNDVWSIAGSQPTPWRERDVGGDGRYVCLSSRDSRGASAPGLAVYGNANAGEPFRFAAWDATLSSLTDRGVIPVSNPPSPTNGLATGPNQLPSLSIIWHPHWPDSRNAMLAVCGIGSSAYGFRFPTTSGYAGEWVRIVDVPLASGDFITAVGSRDGEGVWVGTNTGRIFAAHPDLDPSQSSAIELFLKPGTPAIGDVKLFLEVRTGSLAFAAVDKAILSFDTNGLQWAPLAGGLPSNEPQRGLAYDAKNHHIYAAFDRTVYRSVDEGLSWGVVDSGLPRMAHCSDIAFTALPGGDAFVYLATWGRSVYRLQV